jgi:phage baseplate assembly protein W
MPIERVSKSFKDISLSLQINPLNYDLIEIKNETAIARSLRNLVLTLPGERFFNQNLGSKVSQSLFETISDISASIIQDEIKNTIQNYEPRVNLIEVNVSPNDEYNEYNVTIKYYIVGIDALPQKLTFALQSVR